MAEPRLGIQHTVAKAFWWLVATGAISLTVFLAVRLIHASRQEWFFFGTTIVVCAVVAVLARYRLRALYARESRRTTFHVSLRDLLVLVFSTGVAMAAIRAWVNADTHWHLFVYGLGVGAALLIGLLMAERNGVRQPLRRYAFMVAAGWFSAGVIALSFTVFAAVNWGIYRGDLAGAVDVLSDVLFDFGPQPLIVLVIRAALVGLPLGWLTMGIIKKKQRTAGEVDAIAAPAEATRESMTQD